MLHRFNILIIGLAFLTIYSCQKEDSLRDAPISEKGTIPVNFSLSMNTNIKTDIGYEPMETRADEMTNKVNISNEFKVIIAKEVGNKWILDRVLTNKFDPNDRYNSSRHIITNSSVFHSFNINLTPGEYRAIIITGTRLLDWNDDLIPGVVLEDPNDPDFVAPMACGYWISNQFLNIGYKCLLEEIFHGVKQFTVSKTEDLHSNPLAEEVQLQLDRKVTRLRILLRYMNNPKPQLDFFAGDLHAIVADLKIRDDKLFCNGLDVWGNPFYDPAEPLNAMKYGVFTWREPQPGNDGFNYLVGMYNSSHHAPFYFSDPNVDLNLTISDIEVTANQGMPMFAYASPKYSAGGDPIDITLKHNHTNGIIFMSGQDSWTANIEVRPGSTQSQTVYSMELITNEQDKPIESADIFNLYYEYKSE